MKISLWLFLLSTSLPMAFGQTALIIGDSHMANPLGQYLFDSLSKQFSTLEVRGHASSAPKDWLGDVTISFKGGSFFASKTQGVRLTPSHRMQEVPKLESLLQELRPDIVLVELGANDVNAIADSEGNIQWRQYQERLNHAQKMVSLIREYGAKCLWVGPPNGASKSSGRQKAIYQLLEEATKEDCQFLPIDQRIIYAQGREHSYKCDGYHFHCTKAQKRKAYLWSQQILKTAKF